MTVFHIGLFNNLCLGMNTYTLLLESEHQDNTNFFLTTKEYLTMYSCEFNWKIVF